MSLASRIERSRLDDVNFILKQTSETPNGLILLILSTVSKLTLFETRNRWGGRSHGVEHRRVCLVRNCREILTFYLSSCSDSVDMSR